MDTYTNIHSFFLQTFDAVSWIWAFLLALHLDLSLALLPFPTRYHLPICAVFCHYYGVSLVVTITDICLSIIRLIAYLCVRHALSLQTCRTLNDLVFDLTTSAPFTQFYLQHFLLHGTVRDSIYALLDKAHVIYTCCFRLFGIETVEAHICPILLGISASRFSLPRFLTWSN